MTDSCIGLSCEPVKGNFKEGEWCTIHKCNHASFMGFSKCPQCNWEQAVGVTETLSLCDHGNPTKFGRCLICDPMISNEQSNPRNPFLMHNDILELRTKVFKLISDTVNMENRIESLHEFKLRQCDENKEINKNIDSLIEINKSLLERIEKLELSKSGETYHHIPAAYLFETMNLPDIRERIKKLEEKISEKYAHPDVIGRIEKLEKLNEQCFESNPIKQIEDKFQELQNQIDIIHALGSRHFVKDKKPHKCPVCEGKPLAELRIVPTVNGNDKLLIECFACEGQGIVWG